MAKTVKVTIRKEVLVAALEEFHRFFGYAMQQWSKVERSLYLWFQRATNMDDSMARAIFYGGRGFSARAEMLEAAIECSTQLTAQEIEFLKEALKRREITAAFATRLLMAKHNRAIRLAKIPPQSTGSCRVATRLRKAIQ
jgi:hypothetical protein